VYQLIAETWPAWVLGGLAGMSAGMWSRHFKQRARDRRYQEWREYEYDRTGHWPPPR
jgi:hypothetical protein